MSKSTAPSSLCFLPKLSFNVSILHAGKCIVMGNMVDKSSVIAGYKSANYLEHPLISSYFHSKEIKAYYLSIKHVDKKRDFHSVLISAFTEFLSLVEDDYEILNICIFSQDETSASNVNVNSTITFESIHPEGCKLLGIRDPLTSELLKNAYRKAVMKHHPDRGGMHEAMLLVNEAYKRYQDYLCGRLENRSNELFHEGEGFHCEPKNVNDYIYLLNSVLAEVYCDEWDIVNSYEIVRELQEQQFYGSQLVKTGEEIYRLVKMGSTLTKRLAAANRHSEADDAMRFTRHIYKIGNLEYEPYIEEPENIISGKKKLRIIIKHPRQADNALSIGVITNSRYDSLYKKFGEKSNIEIEKGKILNEYLNSNGFIEELPYDNGAYKVRSKSENVLEIGYYEDNKLHNLFEDQQAEYFIAFSNKTSLDLIRKYTYVRLASYILSINIEMGNQFIDKICNECAFLLTIYDDGQRKNTSTKELIKELGDDIKQIRDTVEEERQEKIDYLTNKYNQIICDFEETFTCKL